ncbi:hypothetical protein L6164_013592 [Bauhinia variegata]|uniref:Uncharacterized protein n=1 Tax=Bauhinia variegata TaxID=167791 RepID=A0ACB9NEJ3_BAUVA|nr:hypothetical protein L6164_013592 [Bauhinia variegata]
MGKQCFSFPEGWLITAAENFEMNMLQPITHVQIKLPKWNTLYRASYLEFPCIILKAGLSANPSRTSDFTVFIVYGTGILAYAKPGVNACTILRKGLRYFVEAAFYKNEILGVDVKGRMRPPDRENDILRTIEHNAYDQDPYAKEFGIKTSEKLASVEARILPAPWLKYQETGNYPKLVSGV